jgi:hypothetical protein
MLRSASTIKAARARGRILPASHRRREDDRRRIARDIL